MNMLKHALQYAANGWAVFPVHEIQAGECACGNPKCKSPGKHPAVSSGVKAATKDVDQITAWWSQNPDANIGIATGEVSGLIVVDIDEGPGKNGRENLRDLEHRYEPLPKDLRVRTGSGGLHIYLAAPNERVPNSVSKVAPNIDIRGDGGYVVAPPSRHISGNRYTWEKFHD